MTRHLKNLRAAFGHVFAYPSYVALASVLSIVAVLLAVWFRASGDGKAIQ